MGPEKRFENTVKQFLKSQGAYFIKYWSGGGYTKSGIPDLLVSCNGFFLGVELKAPKGTPTDLQIRELHRIRDSGAIAILLYPEDMTLFENLIRAITEERWALVSACKAVFEERMKDYE